MQRTVGSADKAQQSRNEKPVRLARVSSGESCATDMLRECPVVTAEGEPIGRVEHLIVDVRTRQVRYVMVACRKGRRVSRVAIPWKTLYFDSALARLVFYTWS
ncbi:PRC-barrel domain-containing protein [Noviherbaspirillum cavernae]|nr:PRC-barrel domain-containing protein [Noviherbaspirillum cavernae]